MNLNIIANEISRYGQQWPSMPPIHIVASTGDLPFPISSNADGAYCDGHVYLIAENIDNVNQVQKVMAHECVLHHSLEEMLGAYGFAKLHSGVQMLKKNGDPVVCELAVDILTRYGKLSPENETREMVARAGERCLDSAGNVRVGFGWMKQVFAGIAGWLRDHGFTVPFSNAELGGIIHAAGRWIERDGGMGQKPVGLNTKGGVVNEGSFSGTILEVVAGVAVQKIGRDENEVRRHAVASLSRPVVEGDVVDIRYKAGMGAVSGREVEVGRGR